MVAMSVALAACHPNSRSSALSSPRAESPAPTPRIAIDPTARRAQLDRAFAAAFPSGASEDVAEMNYTLTFHPARLLPVGGDGTVALVSVGEGSDGACHPCVGKLRITYLTQTPSGFAPLRPAIQADIDGDGFGGGPNDWKVVKTADGWSLHVETSFTEQGCTIDHNTVWILGRSGVVEDKPAEPTPLDC
jgi:hypothetical protein